MPCQAKQVHSCEAERKKMKVKTTANGAKKQVQTQYTDGTCPIKRTRERVSHLVLARGIMGNGVQVCGCKETGADMIDD